MACIYFSFFPPFISTSFIPRLHIAFTTRLQCSNHRSISITSRIHFLRRLRSLHFTPHLLPSCCHRDGAPLHSVTANISVFSPVCVCVLRGTTISPAAVGHLLNRHCGFFYAQVQSSPVQSGPRLHQQPARRFFTRHHATKMDKPTKLVTFQLREARAEIAAQEAQMEEIERQIRRLENSLTLPSPPPSRPSSQALSREKRRYMASTESSAAKAKKTTLPKTKKNTTELSESFTFVRSRWVAEPEVYHYEDGRLVKESHFHFATPTDAPKKRERYGVATNHMRARWLAGKSTREAHAITSISTGRSERPVRVEDMAPNMGETESNTEETKLGLEGTEPGLKETKLDAKDEDLDLDDTEPYTEGTEVDADDTQSDTEDTELEPDDAWAKKRYCLNQPGKETGLEQEHSAFADVDVHAAIGK